VLSGSLTVFGEGARFGNQTSYQLPDENSDFGTPRGGRLTVPIRNPSFGTLLVPSRTIRIAMDSRLLSLLQHVFDAQRGAQGAPLLARPLQRPVGRFVNRHRDKPHQSQDSIVPSSYEREQPLALSSKTPRQVRDQGPWAVQDGYLETRYKKIGLSA